MSQSLNVKDMDTGDLIKRMRAGERLPCPRCGADLVTVPQNWTPGKPLSGIQCPTDWRHYQVHIDDGDAMAEMYRAAEARAPGRSFDHIPTQLPHLPPEESSGSKG